MISFTLFTYIYELIFYNFTQNEFIKLWYSLLVRNWLKKTKTKYWLYIFIFISKFRAGKPATGLHLDVLKDGKLIQKLMIDEKKCYLFGRNPQMNDFCVDHNSCSRVHSALVYHKNLSRAFLVDLGSSEYQFQFELFSLFMYVLTMFFFQLMALLLAIYVWKSINQLSCLWIHPFVLELPQENTLSESVLKLVQDL